MAYEQHVLVRGTGDIGSDDAAPAEHFSFGFAIGALTGTQPTFDGDALTTAVTTYFSRATTGVMSVARLTEVSWANFLPAASLPAHPTTPRRLQTGETNRRPVSVRGGNSSGTIHPPQICYRVSISDGKRGHGHKGGWFMPCPGSAIDPVTMLVDAPGQMGHAESAKQMMQEVTTATGYAVIIASGKNGNLGVTDVRVGRALDTIRSRRRSLHEDYQRVTF